MTLDTFLKIALAAGLFIALCPVAFGLLVAKWQKEGDAPRRDSSDE